MTKYIFCSKNLLSCWFSAKCSPCLDGAGEGVVGLLRLHLVEAGQHPAHCAVPATGQQPHARHPPPHRVNILPRLRKKNRRFRQKIANKNF